MATPTPYALANEFKTEIICGATSTQVGTTKAHFVTTNHTKTQLETAGYFNPLSEHLSVGDGIFVFGDRDGTPFHSSYVVATIPDGGDVTLTEHAAVTSNPNGTLNVRVTALGTATTHYVAVPFAGAVTKVLGVSNANGATSTGTVTITVPTTGAIATLPFTSGYTAGTVVEDTTITAHTLAENAIITVATDGGGDGTGEVIVTLQVTPS